MDYQAQLRHKQQEVTENLVRIGGVQPQETTPILGSKNVFGYRNKMEYSFSNRRWLTQEEIQGESTLERNALGFHKPGMWDKVVDINRCHLQAESANAIRNFVRDYSITHHLDFFDHKNKSGFLRTMMIRNTSVGQWMVVIQFFKEDPPIRTALLDALVEAFPQINSLHYVINSKPNDSIYDQEVVCYHGTPFIEEEMEDLISIDDIDEDKFYDHIDNAIKDEALSALSSLGISKNIVEKHINDILDRNNDISLEDLIKEVLKRS